MAIALGVVLVTYNRLSKLKMALDSFDSQTVLPEYILIVNNASTDGTATFLQDWVKQETDYRRICFTLDQNTGGSGGFYYGLKKAMELSANWIWISDDDAFPEKDAFLKICNCINNEGKDISAVCCTVMNNGEIDTWHRRNIYIENNRIVEKPIPIESYENESFDFNAFSYVGTVVSKSCLEKVGLTDPEYFIFYDDTEHSLRMSKVGKIICCTDAIVYHDQSTGEIKNKKWKVYYKIRNRYITYKRHFPMKYVIKEYSRYFKSIVKYTLLKMIGGNTTVCYEAIMDSIKNKKGKNESYVPGVDISNKFIC